MKIFRKSIETAEALGALEETAERSLGKLWPKVCGMFERAGVTMADEAEARQAWLTAVLVTDTYLMDVSRNMSRAELANVYEALGVRLGGSEAYEYFRSLVLYSLADPSAETSGKLYPLISGLLNALHFGVGAAINIEDDGEPDGLSAAHPALLREISVVFALQLSSWKHVFENYKVTFTKI
jgi:hypothetical protein